MAETESAIPFLSLKDSNSPYMEELKAAAIRVIESGWYINGEEVSALERELSSLAGTSHCVAVSNGLDALRLIFHAYLISGRLQPGDEVIAPANTYIASIMPLVEYGLKPVVVEPDPEDLCISSQAIRDAITPRTKALLPVHLFGNPWEDAPLLAELRNRGVLIVEDNAQAIGAISRHGNATGGIGDAAAFSFYPTKNVGALGDAGAVTTNDAKLAGTIRALANYGSDRRYHNIYPGHNCRMDEIQAAMLRVKLRHLDEIIAERTRTARIYDECIQSEFVGKPKIFDDRRQVWHQYIIMSPHRDALQQHLRSRGIGTDISYPTPPHLQPCYAHGELAHGPLPVTERMARETLNLPIANLTPEQARRVAEAVNNFRP